MTISRIYYVAILFSILLCWLLYVVMLKPQIIRLADLKIQEINEFARLEIIRQQVNQDIGKKAALNAASMTQSDENGNLLTEMVVLAELNNLQVQSAIHLNSGNRIQLVMNGTYASFFHFIDVLAQQKMSFQMDEFTLQALHHGELRMVLEIIASGFIQEQLQTMSSIATAHIISPFCDLGSNSVSIPIGSNITTQNFSVTRMKMKGYLQEHHRASALVRLPDNTVEKMIQGSIVGNEHARVNDIKENRIEFKFPDQRNYILLMDE